MTNDTLSLADELREALAVIAYEQPDEPWRVAHDALKTTARPLDTPKAPVTDASGEGLKHDDLLMLIMDLSPADREAIRRLATNPATLTALRAQPDSALVEACALYDDALDMMFDGPDESDEGYAKARWKEAREKVRLFALRSHTPAPADGEAGKRWSWGYADGVPGTPEYEPAPRICNWCKTVASRCRCDIASSPDTEQEGENNGSPAPEGEG